MFRHLPMTTTEDSRIFEKYMNESKQHPGLDFDERITS